MKAVLLTGAGGIDKLELTEVPDPILGIVSKSKIAPLQFRQIA